MNPPYCGQKNANDNNQNLRTSYLDERTQIPRHQPQTESEALFDSYFRAPSWASIASEQVYCLRLQQPSFIDGNTVEPRTDHPCRMSSPNLHLRPDVATSEPGERSRREGADLRVRVPEQLHHFRVKDPTHTVPPIFLRGDGGLRGRAKRSSTSDRRLRIH